MAFYTPRRMAGSNSRRSVESTVPSRSQPLSNSSRHGNSEVVRRRVSGSSSSSPNSNNYSPEVSNTPLNQSPTSIEFQDRSRSRARLVLFKAFVFCLNRTSSIDTQRLYEQQEKLTSKVEEMIQELKGKGTPVGKKVSRELSVSTICNSYCSRLCVIGNSP